MELTRIVSLARNRGITLRPLPNSVPARLLTNKEQQAAQKQQNRDNSNSNSMSLVSDESDAKDDDKDSEPGSKQTGFKLCDALMNCCLPMDVRISLAWDTGSSH